MWGKPSMKLMMKFNVILLVLFGTAGLAISYIAYGFLTSSARRVVLQQAELMMANAQAVREYTATHIEPLLRESEFHPESVPNFGSITTFKILKKHYPEYIYRETALNPRNPEHRPIDWETEVIRRLQEHPEKSEISGERDVEATGRVLYLARPIKMEMECMVCHSTPDAAPPSLVKQYGPSNGFGWDRGLDQGIDIIGAQIVTVPMTVPVEIANEAYHGLLIYLVATLLLTMAALDAAVYGFVIRPLAVISSTADRVSKGEKNVPPLTVKGSDEIAKVTASFNRMQVSLAKAFKMLD
jgi:HAMP domain-containing protein